MSNNDSRWLDGHGRTIAEEDRGLVYDREVLMGRRRALGLLGGVTAVVLGSATTAAAMSGRKGSALVEVPSETQGPYPADGSPAFGGGGAPGLDVLDDDGIVRRDIRSSFGTSTTTATGVPLTVRLTVRDVATGSVRTGAHVYIWHCDAAGNYSMYSPGLEDENYLRGVQPVDKHGTATFTTIFPGCYTGRWPHIHFEVYSSLADAVGSGPIVKTSQIALPEEVSTTVYARSGYETGTPNLSRITLATDRIFSDDGGIHQMASMSGNVTRGYTASLTVGV